jgi:ectoine hydroxylase-related dioxygenase (phytanoyl-CoA dioxygenase family)
MRRFKEDGYFLAANLFEAEEMNLLRTLARAEHQQGQQTLSRRDGHGGIIKLTVDNELRDDIYSAVVRCRRIVDTMERLLEGEVYHYHHKMILKEPLTGGAWEWHQDYGYWYKNQFIFPDQLMSVMIALTTANKENGCLQVIKGSHKMGRVNHGYAGEQVGADMVMVENALQSMELIYAELEPGDALFFHSNLLHRSEANLSDYPRWSIISCYSLQSNLAYNEKSVSWKTPVEVVPDEAIMEWQTEERVKADFLKKEEDPALQGNGWGK